MPPSCAIYLRLDITAVLSLHHFYKRRLCTAFALRRVLPRPLVPPPVPLPVVRFSPTAYVRGRGATTPRRRSAGAGSPGSRWNASTTT